MPKQHCGTGPSGPVSDWSTAVELAEADRLTLAQTKGLLAALRAGDLTAEQRLIDGHLWLVFAACKRANRHEEQPGLACDGYNEAWGGTLYLSLARSVAQLRNNKTTDALKHIADNLRRDVTKYYRSISPHLLMPASTKAKRKQAADESGGMLIDATIRRNSFDEAPAQEPHERRAEALKLANAVRAAAEQADVIEWASVVQDAAETELERDVIECLENGLKDRKIVNELKPKHPKITRHQVKQIIARLRCAAA